jgi:hypothetical protein
LKRYLLISMNSADRIAGFPARRRVIETGRVRGSGTPFPWPKPGLPSLRRGGSPPFLERAVD